MNKASVLVHVSVFSIACVLLRDYISWTALAYTFVIFAWGFYTAKRYYHM